MHSPSFIPPRTLRTAALAIGCVVVLILVALSHHPTVSGAADAHELHARMAGLGQKDRLVHGALTVMLAVLASALAVFDRALAVPRPSGSGLCLYVLGSVLLGVAMLLDGFFLPALATESQFAQPFDAEVARLIMRAAGILVQEFSEAGLVCHGVAMLAWSYVAAANRAALPGLRWCVGVGAVAGLLPAAAILFGNVVLAPHSLMLIFTMHAAWYLAVAVSMHRAGRHPTALPHASPV